MNNPKHKKISRDLFALTETPLDNSGIPVIVVSGLIKCNKKQQRLLLQYLLEGLTSQNKQMRGIF